MLSDCKLTTEHCGYSFLIKVQESGLQRLCCLFKLLARRLRKGKKEDKNRIT